MATLPATHPVAIATRQLDTLATEMVLGIRAVPEWIEALGTLAGEIRQAGLNGASDEAVALKETLARLDPAGTEFSERARRGLEMIGELLEMAAKPAGAASVVAKSNSLADDPELVADFILELREHLSSIEQQVLAIEQDPGGLEPIHALFRAFHTVKGLAGFLEFEQIQAIAHETETVLDSARNGSLLLDAPVLDIILESADYLDREGRRIEAAGKSGEPLVPSNNRLLREKIRAVLAPDREIRVDSGVVALSRAIDPIPDFSEVDLVAGLPSEASISPTVPVAPASPTPTAPPERVDKAARNPVVNGIRVDIGKLDYLIDMVGEIVIAQSLVRHSPDLEGLSSPGLQRAIAQLSRITGEVQKTAMSMRMVPIGVLWQKLARQVRDLSRKAGKPVDLITTGEDTELDRIIVEELADPLMHMVRNAIDHGIEPAAERTAAGKPVTARLELRASHQSGCIQIEVADDGRGISREKILARARAKGIVAEGAALSDAEVLNLVFEPGLSTAEQVTDISGRGVGMDVVKRRIQKLRGRTEIDTHPGRGTTFRLKLPLTLAIIDGLIVGVGQERYIVPIFAVKEILRPTDGMITSIENRREIVLVRQRVLPVIRLYRRFGVQPRTEVPTESLLIVTESHGREYCLMVDSLLGKQEVVIKNLGQTFRNVRGIAGGAILGDGRVGLILDMNALFGHSA